MSWTLGLGVVGILGLGIGLIASSVKSRTMRFILLGTMPFASAWALYWLPTSPDGSTSEYANWAPIFICPWAAVAYIAAISGFLVFRWYFNRCSE
jgi:putative flippase GtrA